MDALSQGGEIENSEGSGDNMMKSQLFPVESFVGLPAASLRRAVLTLALALGAAGCGEYGGSDTDTSVLGNGNPGGGAPEGLSVAEQVTAFEATVYPVLAQNCEECHGGSGPGAPQLAHPDVATAWSAVVDSQKVNFSDPRLRGSFGASPSTSISAGPTVRPTPPRCWRRSSPGRRPSKPQAERPAAST